MNWQPKMAWGQSPKSATRRVSNRVVESLENRALMAIDALIGSPADNATDVAVGGNLILNFSQDVVKGAGANRVIIKNAADGSLIEAVDVDSSRVTISGSKVTIDPVADLPANTKVFVNVDDGAFRAASGTGGTQVIFSEDFESLHLVDSPLASNSKYVTPDPFDLDDYVVTFKGTLDVKVAGDYTFGGNSDDGMFMLLDRNNDGFADFFDSAEQIIFDDTTHGTVDKLSTVDGGGVVNLKVGKYAFEFGYFEDGGGSSGEFFYAPGEETKFDATKFALFGDDSKGIAISGALTATAYKADGYQVGGLTAAYALIDGTVANSAGYPLSAEVKFADVFNSGGSGNYKIDLPVPGALTDPDDTKLDYAPIGPVGWVKQAPIEFPQPEYNGWTFLNKNFWTRQQGDQARTVFTTNEGARAVGTVAVFDPDAADDFRNIDDAVEFPNGFAAYITLPAINLSGVAENSVNLNFDNSYYPEGNQTAVLDYSTDGVTWNRIDLAPDFDGDGWNTNTVEGGTNSQVLLNTRESFDIPNGTSGELLIRFGIEATGNNWWWAIDNVEIKADVATEVSAPIKGLEAWNFTTASTVAPFPGDVNGDRKVDINDFAILRRNFNKTPATRGEGDLDGSNRVDIADFALLRANFNKSGSVSFDTASSGVAASAALNFVSGNPLADEDNS